MSLPRGLRAARRSTVSDANIRPDAHALVRPELIFQAAALNLAQLEKLLPVACVQFWGGSAQALVTKQRMPQLTLIGTFLDVWSGRMNHSLPSWRQSLQVRGRSLWGCRMAHRTFLPTGNLKSNPIHTA